MCILHSCLWLLGFSVGWSFCVMFHKIFNMLAGQILECLRERFYRHAWSTCCRLVQIKKENYTCYVRFSYGNAWWLFLDFLMACGRWGHVFATSANPRSCIKRVAVSPSFTVRMGENVKRIKSMVQAALVRGRISVGSYQPRDRNTRTNTINRTDLPLRPKATRN